MDTFKPPTLFGATEPRQTPPAGLPVLWFEDVAMRAKVESAMRAAVLILGGDGPRQPDETIGDVAEEMSA